jgi:hypothetical protein
MRIFRVSTSTLVPVARDIALASAAIIASSEAGRAEAGPDFHLAQIGATACEADYR